MTPIRRRLVRLRQRLCGWCGQDPRTMACLKQIGCLRLERGIVARGVAVGLFVGLTPTVGFQTLLMLGLCAVLRGNLIAAFAVSWVSNSVTITPLYLGYYLLGEHVAGPVLGSLSLFSGRDAIEGLLEAACLGLGSMLIALPAAAAGYVLSYWLAHALVLRRRLPA